MNSKVYIAAGSLLLFGFITLVYFTWPKGLINKKEISLTDDQRNSFEIQLKTAQDKLKQQDINLSDNEKALLYFNMGRAQFGLGLYNESRKNYERIIKLQLDNPTVQYDYFNVLLAMQDYKKAEEAARKGVESFPRHADLWKGYIALEKEYFGIDDTQLVSLYIEAMERSFHHPDIVVPFAHYLEEKGNIIEALKYWGALAGQYPDNQLYKEQIKRLEALIK
ncbi:MAG: hypothetical protein Q8P35_02810 [Candidatus Yanofskybacteria bacterium]|nr:hypothetical protein [Candidatus Yanofskybacteria bacterium]